MAGCPDCLRIELFIREIYPGGVEAPLSHQKAHKALHLNGSGKSDGHRFNRPRVRLLKLACIPAEI